MKKISLLKSIGLASAATVAAAAPLALTISCSNASSITTSYISWKKVIQDKNLANMETGHFKSDDLILGSKKFFDGNYILFVGSNTYDNTCLFFSGNIRNRNLDLWSTTAFDASILHNDIFLINQSKTWLDFGFVTFIDNSDNQVFDKSGHKIIVTKDATKGYWATWPIKPFDKWDDGIINQTRQFMKDEFDYDWNNDDENPEVEAGDYIRQDDEAKAFRDLVSRGATLFPSTDSRKTTFDTADGNSTSLMIVYKNGKLEFIGNLQTTPCSESDKDSKDTSTLTGCINNYFLDEESEPEPEPEPEPEK